MVVFFLKRNRLFLVNYIFSWETVKIEEGVTSESMDDLLKMTGLKKVKNATIDLFKSALAFNRMSPELKKANPMSFNYCFMGNAVRIYFFQYYLTPLRSKLCIHVLRSSRRALGNKRKRKAPEFASLHGLPFL
jgi:hypothetical protein